MFREKAEAKAMPTYYDPFGRRVVRPRPAGQTAGSEIQRLVQAYQALQAKVEQQAALLERQQRELDMKQRELENKQRELESKQREMSNESKTVAELRRELAIKDEALRRQGEALKQAEAELVFARAGLKQQEKAEQQKNSPEEMSWRERYIRLQAELDSMRRRWEQRFETETANARQEILRDMLPLADHLEMAIQHGAGSADQPAKEQAEEYLRNLNATYQAFLNQLKRYDVTQIDAQGQPFDPNLHEAVGKVTTGDVPSGAVAQVVQTGYMEGDRLLRPARVLVRE
jgi:molecular chaperone GrpE